MSENLQKLIGVVVMAVLVVVGVAVSSGDDMDYTRNLTVGVNPGSDAKDVDTLILVALADIAETLEGLVEDEEDRFGDIEMRLEVLARSVELGHERRVSSFNIEAFADMITLLCVGDSTPISLESRYGEEGRIMRELDLSAPYNLGELSTDERWFVHRDLSMKFATCVGGWVVDLSADKAVQLLTYLGYGSAVDGEVIGHPCRPEIRRPSWGKEGFEPRGYAPFHYFFHLGTGETNVTEEDIVTSAAKTPLRSFDCDDEGSWPSWLRD